MEEEAELPKPKETKPKFWKDSNVLLSFSAIFISAVTLFILIYQTSLASKQFDLEQKQQLASVMPYVQIIVGFSTSDEFIIVIENFGIGPAFIKNVKMHYDGQVYEDFDYPKMYEILRSEQGYEGYRDEYSNLMKGFVIPAGRRTNHMKITKGERENVHGDIFQTNEILELEIEYASIYDERWVVRGLFNEPVKTKGMDD